MKKKRLIASTGFALFSMFFGSGNLVFPLTVGKESEGHYILAAFGLFLTGVIVPFLGALGILLYNGSMSDFFSGFGKRGALLFSFLALGLLGPFGVVARCLTVAHGALALLIPHISLPLTSCILCGLIYLLAINRGKIVSTLGVFLTPFLLIAIGVIAFFGLYQGNMPQETSTENWNALKVGFFQGYQTMDLLAAFFFSQFIYEHLRDKMDHQCDDASIVRVFYSSSLIGAGILSAVYCALVTLGWIYSPILQDTPPQEMFGRVALEALGSMAAPWVAIAVILACMTTALVLSSLFAELLKRELMQDKITSSQSLIITLILSFIVSTFDFAGIAQFLGPILETIYPALIAVTILNIIFKLCDKQSTHWPFTLTLFAKLCWI